MTEPFESAVHLEDVERICAEPLPWEKVEGARFLVSGATGMIGSLLVDVLLRKGARVVAISRSREKALRRFAGGPAAAANAGLAAPAISPSGPAVPALEILEADVNRPLPADLGPLDYVVHFASNTHPVSYATQPVATVLTNITGTANMLDAAVRGGAKRFAFASSNEVYGENRGDVELFDESYCGYIDPNTLRAGYPESKRCGEALCQAYAREKGLDVVVPRFTRSFGPTLLDSDTKASSQFLRNAVRGEDIVLKSEGRQYYSYTYTADAVRGFLYVLLLGESGQAYNIADESCDTTLRDLAGMIAASEGRRVIFDLPSETEKAGFSRATKARLDGTKLRALGWKPAHTLPQAIERTLKVLKETTL